MVGRLRKRRELDALVVKGTRKRKGASQELLARNFLLLWNPVLPQLPYLLMRKATLLEKCAINGFQIALLKKEK
jgi:hypothetical protein